MMREDPDIDQYTVVVMGGEVFIRSTDVVRALRRTAEVIRDEAPDFGIDPQTAQNIAELWTAAADALDVVALDALCDEDMDELDEESDA